MSLFIDGLLQQNIVNTTDLGTTKPLIIGSKFDGSSSDWQGRVDDVRIVSTKCAETCEMSCADEIKKMIQIKVKIQNLQDLIFL